MDFIGERIKKARREARLTQVELAEMVGISRSHLCAVENGLYDISSKYLLSIASACNKELNFFAGNDGNTNNQ